jgi:hypothetical protein
MAARRLLSQVPAVFMMNDNDDLAISSQKLSALLETTIR